MEWVSEWDAVMWTNLPSVLSFYNLKKKESILLNEEGGKEEGKVRGTKGGNEEREKGRRRRGRKRGRKRRGGGEMREKKGRRGEEF